jgi:hypothetical protein
VGSLTITQADRLAAYRDAGISERIVRLTPRTDPLAQLFGFCGTVLMRANRKDSVRFALLELANPLEQPG